MFKEHSLVIGLSMLWVLAGTSLGRVREEYSGHPNDWLSRQVQGHDKKSQNSILDIARRRQNSKKKNMAAVEDRHEQLVPGFNDRYVDHGGKGHNLHRGHRISQLQGHQLGFKLSKSLQRIWKLINLSETDRILRNTDRTEMRIRRASLTKLPVQVKIGGIRLPQGITYTWTRDVGTGRTFNEAAFKSKDKNVVVVLSFDDALKDANLTASATLYDFTGATGVMAIKPRTRPGPCFLVDTGLTYDKIVGDLDTRNGSSVSTSTFISLDGTGNPVSLAERQAMLKKTPSLSRQCRGREIIRTTRIGSASPILYDGQTKELKLLTMDSELSITVPVDLELDVGQFGLWLQGGPKGSGHVKGQGTWKRQ